MESIQEILRKIEDLKNLGNFQEAFHILEKIHNIQDFSQSDQIEYNIAKSELLYYLGKFHNSLELAKSLLQTCHKSGTPLQLLDASLRCGENYFRLGKFKECNESIQNSEKILYELKNVSDDTIGLRKAVYAHTKACIFWYNGANELALEETMKGMELNKKYGNLAAFATGNTNLGICYAIMGDFNNGLKYMKQGLEICKQIKDNSGIGMAFLNIGWLNRVQGDLDSALKYLEQALKIEKKLDDKLMIENILGDIGIIYRQKNELQKSVEYLLESLEVLEELQSNYELARILFHLIKTYLIKKDLQNANKFFERLKAIHAIEENPRISLWYRISKALILRNSQRTRNLYAAQEIFRNIIDEKNITTELTAIALLNLCDLLLWELETNNDPEILPEFEPLIEKLLKTAESENSFLLTAETYLLQAKLEFLKSDFKKGRKHLIKAQKIAEDHGLKQLAIKISNDHDRFLENKEFWDKNLDDENSLSKHVAFSRLNEQINRMLRQGIIESEEFKNDIPILFIILDENGPAIFSISFQKNWDLDDQLFGCFLSAFTSFSNEIFSELMDRAKFGDQTIIMKAISPYIVSYIFEGSSYFAQQKMNEVVKLLQTNDFIKEILDQAMDNKFKISEEKNPQFYMQIKEIFLLKKQ